MFLVHDIKSFQYVCIVKAGLAVCGEQEMKKKEVEKEIFEEFTMAVNALQLSLEIQGINREILLRSKNYVVKVCKEDDYHDGESVWRKFGEIKRVVVNDFTELYMKNLPGGQLPSGKSKEEIIEKTRKDVFLRQELAKNPKSTKTCPANWSPIEWRVFLVFGAAANEPVPLFYAAYVQPPLLNIIVISSTPNRSTSHKLQGNQMGRERLPMTRP